MDQKQERDSWVVVNKSKIDVADVLVDDFVLIDTKSVSGDGGSDVRRNTTSDDDLPAKQSKSGQKHPSMITNNMPGREHRASQALALLKIHNSAHARQDVQQKPADGNVGMIAQTLRHDPMLTDPRSTT